MSSNALVLFCIETIIVGTSMIGSAGDHIYPHRIEYLCSGQDVCAKNNNTETTRNGCCEECSCQAECAADNNCCYLSMSDPNDRKFQTCENIMITNRPVYNAPEAVFMVTQKPDGGCVNASMVNCCEEDVYPWGTLLPVQSKTTGIYYKTEQYAQCHGEDDVEPMTTLLVCDDIGQFSVSDGCTLMFARPNPLSIDHRCFKDDQAVCPTDFYLDPKHNLTKKDVRKYCERDFYSIYKKDGLYKNVYCFLCQYQPTEAENAQCPPFAVSPIGTVSFVGLIDTNLLKETAQVSLQPNTCNYEKNTNESQQNCRPLLCPEGQLWSVNGQGCVFGSTFWYVKYVTVTVDILFPRGVAISANDLRQLVSDGQLASPWSRLWETKSILLKYCRHDTELKANVTLNLDEAFELNENISHLVAIIVYSPSLIMPLTVEAEVQEKLSKNWTLTIGTDEFQMTQTLSLHSFSKVGVSSEKTPQDMQFMYVKESDASDVTSGSYDVFQTIDPNPSLGPEDSVYITKLFVCNQIALAEHEMTVFKSKLDGTNVALRIQETGTLLYSQAFKIVIDQQGLLSGMICAADYGVVVPPPPISMGKELECSLCIHVLLLVACVLATYGAVRI